MKKIVITYGLISAGISAIMWTIIALFMKNSQNFDHSMLIGYSAMTLSFLLIYFGMAAYRDNVGNGYISYGKAVQIGFLISAIACVCYVIAWSIIYNTLVPDFWDKYAAYELNKMRVSGDSEEKIAKATAQINEYRANYKNPVYFFFMTFMEPLPVAIIITLISGAIVRIKNKPKSAVAG